ncbi:MAG TPA: putative sulfate exporter family transporter [Acidobacteria bacterium]|nr:putative sulfate exporter family transporter [Acidobacteriota bacterium]
MAETRHPLLAKEDWWAIWLSGLLISGVVLEFITSVPGVGRWSTLPTEAFPGRVSGLLSLGLGLVIITAIAVQIMSGNGRRYATAFIPVFALAVLAYTVANQTGIRAAGFGYAFWALLIGLFIANTIGTPQWMKSAIRSELYIKTGLVFLGAEILFGNILNLGLPGLFVAWFVTPVVLIFMYQFGTRILKIGSRSLVIVIAAATSVCGVSAAIAVAAAARAKKEELTLAVGMSLIFTVVMMVAMPALVRALGMDPVVGAAWIGGTIDATGAVVAAGALLGEQAEQIAAVVKMVQNMLIGVVAFLVAVFWVTRIERDGDDTREQKPNAMEIWRRYPKFILGFIAASVIFSFLLTPSLGDTRVAEILDVTSDFRGWFFCLAFVSIGLESRFRDLAAQTSGGRPIQLYLTGQTFNVVLTLIAAYLAFGGILFDRVTIAGIHETRNTNTITYNIETGRDATPLFYTEVDGWFNYVTNSHTPK